MTSEPKLLTVQMAEALGAMSPEARVRMLRERGLIAPEPVADPLEQEVNDVADAVYAYKDPERAYAKNAARVALRRGKEIVEAAVVAWLQDYATFLDKHDDGLAGFDKMAQGLREAVEAIELGEHLKDRADAR